MKKLFALFLITIIFFSFAACVDNKNLTHHGINAEIIEISTEFNGLVVKGLDKNSILGDRCFINCESPETYFIYTDNTTRETSRITFDDLRVGDEITVDIKSVDNHYSVTSRVQLISQR